jgi:riboflavin synthase
MKKTLFKNYKKGSKVNIETDMFARYVAHIISHKKNSLSWGEVDAISAIYH